MQDFSGLIALAIYIACLIVYLRYDAKHQDDEEIEETKENLVVSANTSPLDLNDEDATVASLVAAIECRKEYKKNVRVISVRKVN